MKLLMAILFITGLAFAQQTDSLKASGDDKGKLASLTVKIINLENDKGQVLMALCNSEENYNDDGNPYKGVSAGIQDSIAVYTFENLPFGEYAVKVIHDENKNSELDTNFLGIPKEAYGFSNDARGTFGPPDYDDAKFMVNKEKSQIVIKLN
ncbi:MAG: DUF2141 domain-containing protein [Calditrichaceae bacterium]|nr:DUF2141 domain-containing protein [Calditrichaceae bacterium]